mgnify:CR=1 FL=1
MIDCDTDIPLVNDHDIDFWALRVVVREGLYMRLTRPEKIMAAHLLREKGYGSTEIADMLKASHNSAERMLRTPPPVKVCDVPRDVIGAQLRPAPTFARSIIQPGRRGKGAPARPPVS